MSFTRREFLGSAAAAGGVVAVASAPSLADGASGVHPPRFDAELPIHMPERPVERDVQDPWATADAEILDHGLSPEWRARFVYRMSSR